MLPRERRAVAVLALVYAVRMLGLFMLLPVMALYAGRLGGATPALVGLAIGVYGLTQAGLQVPFGWLSDRWGRRPLITAGLLLFVAGSIVAAFSETIGGVIAGRALQGAGAIAAAVMALAADVTRPAQRGKAMAVLGATIGAAFIAALVLGPLVYGHAGGRGLFLIVGALALLALVPLWTLLPSPSAGRSARHDEPASGESGRPLRAVLADRDLLAVNIGIFCLHAMLTAAFVAVPLALAERYAVPEGRHWLVYLGVMAVSLVLMLPALIVAERRGRSLQLLKGAIATLLLAELWLMQAGQELALFIAGLVVFFAAFNALEAVMPARVSRLAPAARRGAALGAYSSFQFIGAFVGGALGGWLFGRYGSPGVFALGSLLAGIWLIIATLWAPGIGAGRYRLEVGALDDGAGRRMAAELKSVRGVIDAEFVRRDGAVYLKIDREHFDEPAVRRYAA